MVRGDVLLITLVKSEVSNRSFQIFFKCNARTEDYNLFLSAVICFSAETNKRINHTEILEKKDENPTKSLPKPYMC